MKRLTLSLFLGALTVGLVGLTATEAQARPFRISSGNYYVRRVTA
jgi:hypothetical protein